VGAGLWHAGILPLAPVQPKTVLPPTGADPIALVPCPSYAPQEVLRAVQQGFELAPPPDVRGKRVVLKPNFVEYRPEQPVTTDVQVLRALVASFRDLGAKEVVVAEGPGHRRDMDEVWGRSGLFQAAAEDGFRVVDLNVDRLRAVNLRTVPARNPDVPRSLLKNIFLPQTLLAADLLVNVPKLKTHHWTGCTLTLKNLFGVLPGAKYGWPKNILHYNGIERSIIELNSNIPVGYSLIDGVVGMEGDGPIMGTAVHSGCLVLGRSRMAVDWTGAHLMGLDPRRIPHLKLAASFGIGKLTPPEMRGEDLNNLKRSYQVLPKWEVLRG
jgi:uncharacterized protein (DUF362 family)